MTLLRCCLAIVLMTSLSFAQTQPAGADALISDFEGKLSLLPSKATAEIGPGDAAQGVKFLRLKPHTPEAGKAYLKLPLPDDVALFAHERLTAQLRVPATQPNSSTQPAPRQQIRLSWMALNAQNQPIFQRQLLLEPNDKWVKLESPLRTWLWDQRRVGDWDEVESLVLRIDSADVAHVDVDDVRLEGLAKPGAQTEWLLDLAFGAGAPRKVASGDGLMVATDAVDAFSAEDLERLLDDMRRTRAFVRRVFGDAVRPTDDIGVPASLLIFEDEARQAAFFQRLGREWNATIAPSTAQGYTVQDIATSTYKQELGTRRPVYLHESVHAVVARDLRLLTGNARHAPLQEGLATYLQLCAHAKSIERDAFARAFEQPIDPSGKGFFKPLDRLFAARPTTDQYAQLASVVAYLVEKDQPLLRDLAKGLADGQSPADVLARRGPTWAALEEAWLAWGRENFKSLPNDEVVSRPPEFQ
jgi:hypothetical protein